MHEVLTLGESMALLQPASPIPIEQAQSLSLGIAGAESNLAIGLSRLGYGVHFISRVGDDPFGRRILTTLAAEGVDTSGILVDRTAPTGIYFKEWLPDGQRRVFYYRRASAASHLSPADLRPEVFAGVTFVHLTGITPALSPSCVATVQRAIDLARQAGALVSFDPNYRSQLWTATTAREVLLPFLAQADILLMSHEDAQVLFESEDETHMLERALACGPGVVILKRGERGAWAMTRETSLEVPAEAVETVIDPVGAGDGFNAGFLASWLRGENLEAALRLGAKIGAAAVASAGDYTGYPRL